MDYSSETHHSSADVYDHLQAGDLMEASAIMAAVVYASTREEMLSRKALPKPQPPKKRSTDALLAANWLNQVVANGPAKWDLRTERTNCRRAVESSVPNLMERRCAPHGISRRMMRYGGPPRGPYDASLSVMDRTLDHRNRRVQPKWPTPVNTVPSSPSRLLSRGLRPSSRHMRRTAGSPAGMECQTDFAPAQTRIFGFVSRRSPSS